MKLFLQHDQRVKQKFKYLENEKSFSNKKCFSSVVKGFH